MNINTFHGASFDIDGLQLRDVLFPEDIRVLPQNIQVAH
jgi:hypothetical protein